MLEVAETDTTLDFGDRHHEHPLPMPTRILIMAVMPVAAVGYAIWWLDLYPTVIGLSCILPIVIFFGLSIVGALSGQSVMTRLDIRRQMVTVAEIRLVGRRTRAYDLRDIFIIEVEVRNKTGRIVAASVREAEPLVLTSWQRDLEVLERIADSFRRLRAQLPPPGSRLTAASAMKEKSSDANFPSS